MHDGWQGVIGSMSLGDAVGRTLARLPRGLVGRRDVSPYVVLVVMCVGYFLVLLDVTIVNVALPSIASGIGAGVTGLQWIVDGYALALASLMLAGGTIVTSTVIGVSSWRAWWSSGSDRLAARWSAASGR